MNALENRRWVLLAFTLGAFSCGAGGGTMLTPEEARKIVQEQVKAAGYATSTPVTPAIPLEWPPKAGSTKASYFVFGARGLSTSSLRVEVFSPNMRIDLDASKTAPAPVVTRLEERRLASETERGMPRAKQNALLAAQRAMLETIATGATPSGKAAGEIRTGYQGWMTANPSIAGELQQLAPAFMKWLAEK